MTVEDSKLSFHSQQVDTFYSQDFLKFCWWTVLGARIFYLSGVGVSNDTIQGNIKWQRN